MSARFAIAAAETVAAAARHRGAVLGEQDPVARVVDLGTVIDVLRGKLEFESGEEGREQAVLEHLLRRATADTAQRLLGGIDVGPLVAAVEDGSPVTTGERVSAKDVLAALPDLPVVDAVAERLGAQSDGQRAAAVELALGGAVSGQADRQGVRRGRNRLWLAGRRSSARTSCVRSAPGSHSRIRYTGGPDPLAPPVDLREALEQIGQDVMEGTLAPAGAAGAAAARHRRTCAGADKLAAEANRRRRELLQRNNLDGTLQEIKKLLDEAVLAERKELARALDDDARFGELQLESLPPSPAKAVQELSDYDWRSPEARQKYEQIKDLLGREMLDQRFAGMKQALENATDEDRQRVNDMLDDLNDLLDKHARGEDTPARLRRLHGQARRVLPGEPAEHRRAAGLAGPAGGRRAAVPQQPVRRPARRAGCVGAAGVRFAVADERAQPARRAPAGGPARARTGTARSGSRGDDPLGMGEGAQALADIAELEQLAEQLSQSYAGATMDDVDLDMLARQLGDEAAVDARTLAELERALMNQGFLDRGSDGQWRLSPKAMRQLGQTALRDVAQQLSGRHGERDTRRAGAAGELTGATRPWAVRRHRAVERHPHADQRGAAARPAPGSRPSRRFGSPSTTSRSPRPRPAPRPWWRCWSTRRSRW